MGTPTLLSSSSTPTLLLSRHFSRAPTALNYTTNTHTELTFYDHRLHVAWTRGSENIERAGSPSTVSQRRCRRRGKPFCPSQRWRQEGRADVQKVTSAYWPLNLRCWESKISSCRNPCLTNSNKVNVVSAFVYQSQHMDRWQFQVCSLGLSLERKRDVLFVKLRPTIDHLILSPNHRPNPPQMCVCVCLFPPLTYRVPAGSDSCKAPASRWLLSRGDSPPAGLNRNNTPTRFSQPPLVLDTVNWCEGEAVVSCVTAPLASRRSSWSSEASSMWWSDESL